MGTGSIVLAVAVFGAAVSAQQVAVTRLSLYDAAAADPLSFGQALAQRGASAGLILAEPVFAGKRVGVSIEEGAPRGTVTDAIVRFNGAHKGLKAEFRGRTVIVRGVLEPGDVQVNIEARKPIDGFTNVAAGDAILGYAADLLRQTPRTGTGVVSSGPMPGTSCPIGKRVSVVAGNKSLQDVLNEVTEQVPGLVWLVTYDPALSGNQMKIGYLCPDGVSRRVQVR
jgi:hypothetical protein